MTYRIVPQDESLDNAGGEGPFSLHSQGQGNLVNDQYEAEDDVNHYSRVQILTHPQRIQPPWRIGLSRRVRIGTSKLDRQLESLNERRVNGPQIHLYSSTLEQSCRESWWNPKRRRAPQFFAPFCIREGTD